MATTTDHQIDMIEAELDRLQEQHRNAVRTHGAALDRAQNLRSSADRLVDRSDPLRRVLDGVRSLHVTDNWQGNSATRSRNRLTGYEQRCAAALVAIDGLVADLQSEARVQSAIASRSASDRYVLGSRINLLRTELD